MVEAARDLSLEQGWLDSRLSQLLTSGGARFGERDKTIPSYIHYIIKLVDVLAAQVADDPLTRLTLGSVLMRGVFGAFNFSSGEMLTFVGLWDERFGDDSRGLSLDDACELLSNEIADYPEKLEAGMF